MQALPDAVEIERHVDQRCDGFAGSDFIDKLEEFTRGVVDHLHVDLIRLEPAFLQHGAKITGDTGRF